MADAAVAPAQAARRRERKIQSVAGEDSFSPLSSYKCHEESASAKAEPPRRIAQYCDARRNSSDDHTAWSHHSSIADDCTAGDDTVGVDGHEVADARAACNRAVTVDLAPVADVGVVPYDRVFLNASEFANMGVDRDADLGRNDAAMAQAGMPADVGAWMHDRGEIYVVRITQHRRELEAHFRIAERRHEYLVGLRLVSERITYDANAARRSVEYVASTIKEALDLE